MYPTNTERAPRRPRLAAILAAGLSLAMASAAQADEGMWLFNNPPATELRENYGFTATAAWLEHLQKSCVKFGAGGSASIISPNGLLLTNHHVASDQIAKLSTPQHDLMEDGFLARSMGDELKCPDVEVRVLHTIEDVTSKINAAAKPDMSVAEAREARSAAKAQLEQRASEQSGLECEVVTLYGGARYHMYGYKRYTDVRLVFCPPESVAAFGGDVDNFEYPRWCLDMTICRLYENGAPAQTEHYLRIDQAGCQDGDLVFVGGHPARTQRGFTVDHVKFLRDVMYPRMLRQIWRREVQLQTFSARNDDYRRAAQEDFDRYANWRKAYTGYLAALQNPAIMKEKEEAEKTLRAAAANNPEWAGAWDQVSQATADYEEYFDKWLLLIRTPFYYSDLWDKAITLVQITEEMQKPNEKRLREFRDGNLDSEKLALFSEAPISPEFEINRIASTLSALAECYGADDPLVQLALEGQSPQDRATEIVRGSGLFDAAKRRELFDGGRVKVQLSNDPMIRFARLLDPEVRAIRKRYEDKFEAATEQAYAKIVAARFASQGENTYPDATFSLRLSYGTVKGCYQDGEWVEPFTTIAGLYDRFDTRGPNPPFSLPENWLKAKNKLNKRTPYNFISTCDIIGGNSGSPVVDRDGEVVGLIFDGNLASLVWGAQFEGEFGRAVSVDIRGILEAMRTVYKADWLVKEMTGQN